MLFPNSKIGQLKKYFTYDNQFNLPVDTFRIDKKKDVNTLYIYSPALDPNKSYKYLVGIQKGVKEADQLYDIWDLLAQDKYKDAKNAFLKLFPYDYKNPYNITFDGKGASFCYQFDASSVLKGAYNTYNLQKSGLKNYSYPDLISAASDSCLQDILHRTLTKDCKDCRLKYKGFIDSLELFDHAVINIRYPDTLFSKGYLALTNRITDKAADGKDYDQRLANLKTSANILNQLKYFIRLLSLENAAPSCAGLSENIEANLAILKTTTKQYTEYVKARTAWKDALLDKSVGLYMYRTDQSGVSTNIFDFKTRNRNYINACFGLVSYGAVYGQYDFSQFSRFYDVSPFVGVNFNLRPIDKDLPLSKVPNKTFWTRSALFAGITLSSVKDAAGTREDFFNKSSASLLLGGAYRITNAIRLNYGALLFKRYDTNPVLNRKIITASPFVGLDIDLDLKELFGDVTSIFK